jgi:hydroxypyruvate isomerase
VLKYAVNVSMVGHPHPLEERLRRVAEAGFKAVEFWFPHQFDMGEMARRTGDLGLEVALFDLEPSETHPYGHWADPDAGDEFFRRLDDAFETARLLGCKTLNVLQGGVLEGVSYERQLATGVERLGKAAPMAEREGILLCVEGINTIDRPGSFCWNTRIGTALVDAVDSPAVRFQYDVYHMQLMEGNVIRTLRENIGKIGHVQLADPPGRNEPGTGEINFANVLTAIEELDYKGWVSLEYWPSDPDRDSFGWLPREQRSAR